MFQFSKFLKKGAKKKLKNRAKNAQKIMVGLMSVGLKIFLERLRDLQPHWVKTKLIGQHNGRKTPIHEIL